MAKNSLSGLERKLVIDYLIKESPSLTLTLDEETFPKESAFRFPIALRGEQTKILDEGIIIAQSESISSLEKKSVKLQFYFNKLALYFSSKLQKSSAGWALVIPEVIYKQKDEPPKSKEGFSVTIYYESNSKESKKTDIVCDFDESFPLFVESNYKERIEAFLSQKNSIQTEAISGRIHAPKVIYLDEKKIVFASQKIAMPFSQKSEYALLLKFPIAGPLKERKVYLTCVISEMFESYECDKLCACADFSSIREEDERFLNDFIHK